VVSWLQLRLSALGIYSGPVTGYFGPLTQSAVKAFQKSRGLSTTGTVGPATARELVDLTWTVDVRKGDTIAAIASRLGVLTNDLLRANPQVTNPNRIFAGQKLNVPVPDQIMALTRPPADVAGDGSVTVTGSSLTPVTAPPEPAKTAVNNPAKPAVSAAEPPLVVRTPLRLALTFNDGPDPVVLPRILEILKQYSVPATFFFTGREMSDFPDLVRQTASLGHTVESHGWRHEPVVGRPETRTYAELVDCSRTILGLTGRKPSWFRPPGGAVDAAAGAAAARSGMRLVWWHNIGQLPSDAATVGRLDRYLSDGSVIMLPAADPATPAYLGALLERWTRGGVCFCPLDDSLGISWGW